MLYCPGYECPLRADCYRHTQPTPGRAAFAALPYDPATATCASFVTNVPSAAQIRETAYYIWLRAGRPADHAQADWDAAYRSLCQSMGRAVPPLERRD